MHGDHVGFAVLSVLLPFGTTGLGVSDTKSRREPLTQVDGLCEALRESEPELGTIDPRLELELGTAESRRFASTPGTEARESCARQESQYR